MSSFSNAQPCPLFATDLSSGGDSGGSTATIEREPDAAVQPEEKSVADAVDETPTVTFADLGLSGPLLESIGAVGYEVPTPIQERVVPVLLEGQDVIAQAQTGSGKTAAFGFPIIERIDPEQRGVQALILCPTRELAIQVSEALHKYGRHKRVDTLPIYGGQPYERQFRGLQRGVQIVVGTPGRVMDHMRRGTLSLDSLSFFILDEADEMLDMGFIEDIEWILQQAPDATERQTALFSATMPPRIADLASRYMNEPQRISVRGKQMTVPETHQTYYEAPRARKTDALTRILDAETPSSAMIFCRTKNGVDELGEALMARGYAVETLHGDLSQAQRDRVMRRFRSGQADILIATDVAARGLDIPAVSHVINYDIPESAETYVHRIGRTGRAGRGGEAVTLVTPRETRWMRSIERITNAKIEFRRLPTASDVNVRRREVLKNLVRDQLGDQESFAAYLEPVQELAEEEFDSVDIAAALLKLYAEETGRSTTVVANANDVAMFGGSSPRDGGRDGGGGRRDDSGMTRLMINIGRNAGVRPQDVVGAIANEANIPGRSIGAIDIMDAHTFVDVPGEFAPRVIAALTAASVKGRPVNVEIAAEGAGPDRGSRGGGGGDFRRGPRRDGRGYGGDRRGGTDRPGGGGRFGPRRDEEGRGRRYGGGYGNNGPRQDRGSRPEYRRDRA